MEYHELINRIFAIGGKLTRMQFPPLQSVSINIDHTGCVQVESSRVNPQRIAIRFIYKEMFFRVFINRDGYIFLEHAIDGMLETDAITDEVQRLLIEM